ncbi:MAG: WYL domain-containing protein [Myxococcaceae bacterium]|nr:WYL domain-containing protein [Myxococcaceae bacterium]
MSTEHHERLRRLLFLVPWVSRHPGRPVDEVAQALGVTRAELLEALEQLTLVGRPPFQPDDFVDIFVEDDRVFVELDQRLSVPPRLTAAEGVALAAAARVLGPASSDALGSALQKLERVLPAQAVARFRELGHRLDAASEGPAGLGALSWAISERREVRFDYFAQVRGQTERRQVRPAELFTHHGQWYLAGHDVGRGAERLFRVDRMGPLEVTDVTFEPPASPGKPRVPGAGASAEPVTVLFSRARAAWVRERFSDARPRADGAVEVSVPGDNVRWLTGWVLSFGGDARVVSPPWAIRSVAEAARASLE